MASVINEVARLHDADSTGPNIAALDKQIAEVERQRTNLVRRIATIDDEELATPFLVEIQALSNQHKQLHRERNDIEVERRGWQLAQERLDDLQWWCCVQSERLANLNVRAETSRTVRAACGGKGLKQKSRPAILNHDADRSRSAAQ